MPERLQGRVTRFVATDGLGEIELQDGTTVLFGVTACSGFGPLPPAVGAAAYVSDLRSSPTGRQKAYRVEACAPVPDREAQPVPPPPRVDPESIDVYVPKSTGPAAAHELSQVDWAGIRGAYGAGKGVDGTTYEPRQILLDILDADAETRDQAYDDGVAAVLWHQGNVYDATAHAVPFLAAYLADPQTLDRDKIAGALCLMAAAAYRQEGSSGLRCDPPGPPHS